MPQNERNWLEHYGKHDGLQDEYLNNEYTLQLMSNNLAGPVEMAEMSVEDSSPYEYMERVLNRSFGRPRMRRRIPDSSYLDRGYATGDRRVTFDESGDYRRRREEERWRGRDRRLNRDKRNRYRDNYYTDDDRYDDYGSSDSSGSYHSDYMEDPRRNLYNVNRPYDYEDDYIRDREYRREKRWRRQMGGGRRAQCEPTVLPYNTSFYPYGPCGPRVQWCPYVPLTACY